MELGVGERLVLLSVLPTESNYVTLKIVRKLQEDLSFTEEENKLYNFKQDSNRVTWDASVPQTKDVQIGEKANDIIKEALKKLNDTNKLKPEHIGLYEKFVEK